MSIEDIILTKDEAIRLQKLKDDFNVRYQNSRGKKELLAREIKGYSLLFDEDKLPLPILSHDDEPLEDYSVPEFNSMQIWLIRKFWIHFIVNNNNIDELEENDWDDWFYKLNDFVPDYLTDRRLFYSLALVYCRYLLWLNNYLKGQKTNAELALLSIYRNEIIKKGKGKLYIIYLGYVNLIDRIGAESSELKNKNKIKLFEKVIKELSGDAKDRAEKDLMKLKFNIENDIFKK